jgi:hypothetical protein
MMMQDNRANSLQKRNPRVPDRFGQVGLAFITAELSSPLIPTQVQSSERITPSDIDPTASGNQTRPSRVKAAAPPPLTTLSSRRPNSIHEIDRLAGVASGVALAASTQDSPALSADA